jgi:hypothetical protein
MRLALAFPLAALVASGCAEPNTLTGSIDQSHDLSFETVQLQLLTGQGAYELKYLKALEGGGDDTVAKVVFDQPEGGVVVDEELDLVALNGRVERITAANDPFPAVLQKANATFAAGGNDADEATSGSFAATFDNGKTLNGTFETTLKVIDF